jgi:hypothetical protein
MEDPQQELHVLRIPGACLAMHDLADLGVGVE